MVGVVNNEYLMGNTGIMLRAIMQSCVFVELNNDSPMENESCQMEYFELLKQRTQLDNVAMNRYQAFFFFFNF